MHKLAWVFSFIVIAYLTIGTALFFCQRFLLYPVNASGRMDQQAEAPKPFQNFDVTTPDGISLRGWYLPPKGNNPTIVYFHGNGDNLPKTLHYHDLLTKRGFGLLLTSYAGYSGNKGHPREKVLYRGGQSFIDALVKQGTKESDIIIYGFSLGTGVATEMALRYPQAKALVLGAPFTSIADAAGPKWPIFPVRYMLVDRYNNLSKIDNVMMPTLIINGKGDTLFPAELGKRLADAAPKDKVTFLQQEGDHVSFFFDYGGDKAIADWLSQFLSH